MVRSGGTCGVRRGEVAGGAGEGEGDFVLTDGREGFEIDLGIEPEGFGKIDVAARETVAVSAEGDVAGKQMDMAEDGGMLPGAASAQVGFGFELRAGPFHACIGAGDGFDIELTVTQERRVGDRRRAALFG